MKKTKANKNPIYRLQYSKLWSKNTRRIVFNGYKRIFLFFQKLGIHIVPNHYYSPIPDTRTLNERIFSRKTELIGFNINEKKQLELLELFDSNYKMEYESFPRYKTKILYQYYLNNGNFRSVDGEILYCMIRHFKPKRIIEIGSGYSTFCSAQAIVKNRDEDKNYECKLIAIEPFPKDIFRKGFPGFSKLISKNLQEVPLSEFKKLEENDILFIDSSHVLKIGGDVQYEYLEILPRLKKGVIIHIHDILLPAEYPREYILEYFRFWTEQYLVQAFLLYNTSFEILWMSKYMHIKYQNKLEKVFISLKNDRMELSQIYLNSEKKKMSSIPNNWPSSFWMKKIK